jgi:hypothetical protein
MGQALCRRRKTDLSEIDELTPGKTYQATLWSCTVESKGNPQPRTSGSLRYVETLHDWSDHHYFFVCSNAEYQRHWASVESVYWHSWQKKMEREEPGSLQAFALELIAFGDALAAQEALSHNRVMHLHSDESTYHYPTFDDFTFVLDIECTQVTIAV